MCGSVCATPVAYANTCNPDPCTSDGLCEEGLTCISKFTGSGVVYVCDDLGQTLWAECDLDGEGFYGDDGCANNLFCRDNVGCGATDDFFDGPRCMNPVTQEGALCDSDLDDPDCLPCAPGLHCYDNVCLRACTSDHECACDDETDDDDRDAKCHSGKCRDCRVVRDPCDQYFQCCDGSQCTGTSPSGHDTCCFAADGTHNCDSAADCCSGVCAPTTVSGPTVCQTCKGLNNRCITSSQCCGALSCNAGRCVKDCDPGADCTVPGAKGVCAAGTWSCDGSGNGTCVSIMGVQAETCNGLDDDCDGEADQGLNDDLTPCSPATRFFEMSAGSSLNEVTCGNSTTTISGGHDYTLNASGYQVCYEGESFCAAITGVGIDVPTFCISADGTNTCGQYAGNVCGTTAECAPGYTCSGPPPTTCHLDETTCGLAPGSLGWCWLPGTSGDVGACPWYN